MKRLRLLIIALAATVAATAQTLSVNTDLLMDALCAPSVGIEGTVGDRTTLGGNIVVGYHPYGKNAKFVAVQPELRYYFSGRPMHHWFVGLGGLAATYDITWSQKHYKGMAVAAGPTFGYVFLTSRRWNVDCHAGLGLLYYRRREHPTGSAMPDQINAHGWQLLPTRIGVSINYIIR